MIEVLILLILIGGIVYAAQRWPEIERRVFPHEHKPVHHAAHHRSHPHAAHHETVKEAPAEPKPEPAGTSIAKGFMKKKPITTEPEVDPEDFHKTQGAAAAPPVTPPPAKPAPEPSKPEPEEAPAKPAPEPSKPEPEEAPAKPAPEPSKPEPAAEPEPEKPAPTPGAHVTGTPARPSQPAYVDATSNVNESVEDLAAEADQAYRDRDYERAEQACLKILMREPRNHKYMTRIGQVYQEMGNLEDAKEAYEAAKKLDPKNFFVLNRLAEVERMLSDKGGRTDAHKVKPKQSE